YLDEYGVPVDLEPEKPRMEALVEQASERGAALLAVKRRREDGKKGRTEDRKNGRQEDVRTEEERQNEKGQADLANDYQPALSASASLSSPLPFFPSSLPPFSQPSQ